MTGYITKDELVSSLVTEVELINTHLGEMATKTKLGHVKLPEDWINATLENGWTQTYAPLQYCKDDFNIVHVCGEVSGGTIISGTTITTLPIGYRPKSTIPINCIKADDASNIITQIAVDGKILIWSGTTTTGTLRINATFKVGEV